MGIGGIVCLPFLMGFYGDYRSRAIGSIGSAVLRRFVVWSTSFYGLGKRGYPYCRFWLFFERVYSTGVYVVAIGEFCSVVAGWRGGPPLCVLHGTVVVSVRCREKGKCRGYLRVV